MREYELVIVLRPEMDEPEVMQIVERVKKLVTENGGTVLKEENWGKRKLAYPIQRVFEGTYVLAQFQAEPDVTQQVDSTLKVSEQVLRHLLLKKEE